MVGRKEKKTENILSEKIKFIGFGLSYQCKLDTKERQSRHWRFRGVEVQTRRCLRNCTQTNVEKLLDEKRKNSAGGIQRGKWIRSQGRWKH